MIRVMFVCTGNICRSPLAHRVLERELERQGIADQVSVESSGIGSWHVGEEADSRMRATAAGHGLPFSHRARRLSREEARRYDLLFGMAGGHMREISSLAGGDPRGDMYLFRQFDPAHGTDLPVDRRRAGDVPDPYYGGPDGFEEVWQMVERTCRVIAERLADGSLP